MSQAVAAQPQANSRLVIPFMNAVREVFKKMAGVDTTVGKPFLKAQPTASYDVCGIIGFTGEVAGSVLVSFSNAAAVKLVEKFAGMRLEIGTPDFADAVGELANMIAGSAKPHLGGIANISVPSVVIGKGYSVTSLSKVPCLVIPCGSPFGEFAVEVCIQQFGAR